MKSALEGEYGLFFGQGAFLEAALTGDPGSSHLGPTSEAGSPGMSTALPPQGRHSALLERAGSGHPGRRAGGQADRRVPTALLLGSLPFRFLKSPVSVDSTIRRDLFVEESFQLCCLTGR